MSEFSCPVVRVKIEPHPQADQIEIAQVGGYQSIVRKGQFEDGNLAIYIPEQAVIPEWLLREMSLWDEVKQKGRLAGSKGDRVKAVKLRGVVSQGLLYPIERRGSSSPPVHFWSVKLSDLSGAMAFISIGKTTVPIDVPLVEPIGLDAAKILGIVKYEPPIPTHMRGRIIGADMHATHKYDFDNLKKAPELFEDGEQVVITEKIHGTNICIGVLPEDDRDEKYYKGRVTVSSKGMGAKGFALDHNDDTNVYTRAAKKHGLLDKVLDHLGPVADTYGKPVFLIGEVFGVGIQDLTYTGKLLDFRAFDIAVGNRGSEIYMNWDDFNEYCKVAKIPMVPLLYSGPYSKAVVLKHTDGPTTLHDGKSKPHIREGVVVKSAIEKRHKSLGRKIAKSVSDAYLLRKGGTELN